MVSSDVGNFNMIIIFNDYFYDLVYGKVISNSKSLSSFIAKILWYVYLLDLFLQRAYYKPIRLISMIFSSVCDAYELMIDRYIGG